MSARISFIVPTFNRATFLKEALEAILLQAMPDDEVLVVDDGSTDGTADAVAIYAPRVRYLHQNNAGKSVALNTGLGATSGDLVWICDDDDILLPGAVSTLRVALADPAIDLAFGRYYAFRQLPSGERERMAVHWPNLNQGSVARHLLEDAFIMQNATLVRRRCYDEIGPFDTKMLRSLDYEMFVRLVVGFRVRFVDQDIFAQRKHDGARGPASIQHAASRSEQIWLEYDQRIFRRLNADAHFAVYRSMFRAEDPRYVERAAYLQRACVSARHGLWEQTIADIKEAGHILPGNPLNPEEYAICKRMLSGKHDFAEATHSDVTTPLRQVLRGGGPGGQAVQAMLAGGLWRFRRREGKDVATMTKMIWKIAGPFGAGRLLLSHFVRNRGAAGGSVSERSEMASLNRLGPVSQDERLAELAGTAGT